MEILKLGISKTSKKPKINLFLSRRERLAQGFAS